MSRSFNGAADFTTDARAYSNLIAASRADSVARGDGCTAHAPPSVALRRCPAQSEMQISFFCTSSDQSASKSIDAVSCKHHGPRLGAVERRDRADFRNWPEVDEVYVGAGHGGLYVNANTNSSCR